MALTYQNKTLYDITTNEAYRITKNSFKALTDHCNILIVYKSINI